MAPISRASLLTFIQSNIPGGTRATATQVRTVFNKLVESLVSIVDDKDAAGGYPGLDAGGKLDPAFLEQGAPAGKFLRDDGTFASPSADIAGDISVNDGAVGLKDFSVAHGIGSTPKAINVTPASADATGTFYITAVDAVSFTVRFNAAPPAGSGNVKFYWTAKK